MSADTTTTIITNAANGAITRITVVHPHRFNYGLMLLAVLGLAFIAVGLRELLKKGPPK